MSATPDTANVQTASDLAVILPEPEKVVLPRKGGTTETLEIMPLPFRKWRQGFKYIAQIAPLFGFNLQDVDLDKLEAAPAQGINKETIFEAMQGEKADIIYEFLAFAINKTKPDGTPDDKFFDDVYEQAIDVAVAVIKVNYNFFLQRLLPKITTGTKETLAELSSRRLQVSTNGQPQ
jgi:hypothetical protein